MKKLVIIGAGGFGREVLAWARQAREPMVVKGFLDDNAAALDNFHKSVGILGNIENYRPTDDEVFICAMGQVESKRRCIEMIKQRGGAFTQVIHSTAVVGENAILGEGVILCPFSIVASDARLGRFVSVNLHSSVAHDASVGDWTQLHCHVDVTGWAAIGERVTIGSHASVLPGVAVGDDVMIGAGSVVTKNVGAGTTVFGVPARPYRKKEAANESGS